MDKSDRTYLERECSLQAAHRVIADSLAAKRDLASNMMWLRLSLLADQLGREADPARS